MNQNFTQPFFTLKRITKLALFFLGCLLLLSFILFYSMGDKMSEGIANLPEEGASVKSLELVPLSFHEQKNTTGHLMRELMLVSVYQVTTDQRTIDILVDATRVAEFENKARSGNLEIQFVEGRSPGFYPDMATVRERMIKSSKSPWRGRLFGSLVFITSL